jgi:hypothetical protein
VFYAQVEVKGFDKGKIQLPERHVGNMIFFLQEVGKMTAGIAVFLPCDLLAVYANAFAAGFVMFREYFQQGFLNRRYSLKGVLYFFGGRPRPVFA